MIFFPVFSWDFLRKFNNYKKNFSSILKVFIKKRVSCAKSKMIKIFFMTTKQNHLLTFNHTSESSKFRLFFIEWKNLFIILLWNLTLSYEFIQVISIVFSYKKNSKFDLWKILKIYLVLELKNNNIWLH